VSYPTMPDNLLTDNRYATLTSPALDPGKVKLRWMKGVERIGEPFMFEAKIISRDPIRELSPLIGQSATTAMKMAGGATRFFNGIITRCRYVGIDDTRRTNYLLEIRPWLWLLDQRRNSRVFQNKTTREIVRTIFAEHPQSAFVDRTKSSGLPPLEYCVQYEESDLAFVSRLLEREGIYFYFDHFPNRHELVLVNDPSAHKPCDPDEIATHLNLENPGIRDDIIWEWQEEATLVPSQVMLNDYDFEKPNADLKRIGPVAGAAPGKREAYHYPGGYTSPAEGQVLARFRAEEIACRESRVSVSGNLRPLKPGYVFKAANPFDVTDSPRAKQIGKRYLVIGVSFEIQGESGVREDGDDERWFLYRGQVEALVATTPYRPPLRTPGPMIAGPQTALVVGRPGEEVTTDRFGRIKVRFFWDRYGGKDGNSSCWVRVAQNWAGQGLGGLVTPREGQEVVVAFENGSPDRPLVIGAVYNQTNMPPGDLPRDATRSIFKTRSSPDGLNAHNELRFEDRRGAEHVYLKAQRNHVVDVMNLYALAAGGSATITSKTRSVLEAALVPGAATGSRIEVTPQGIALRVVGPAGVQSLVLGPDGITLEGTMIKLLAKGMILMKPVALPLPPQLAAAFAAVQVPQVAKARADAGMDAAEAKRDRS
jgi:type VI secretion system secreted protein VgrG